MLGSAYEKLFIPALKAAVQDDIRESGILGMPVRLPIALVGIDFDITVKLPSVNTDAGSAKIRAGLAIPATSMQKLDALPLGADPLNTILTPIKSGL